MTTRTRKTTRRTRLAGAAVPCLLLAVALAATAQKKPGPDEAYALVAGTVFREPGFTQAGAKVVLALEGKPGKPGKKLQEQMSSPTGEFAFRVKPGASRYTVTATLKGFVAATKTVEIFEQEQVHATLMLVPESKK